MNSNPHLERLDLFETGGGAAPLHRQFKTKKQPKEATPKPGIGSVIRTPFDIILGFLFGPRMRWHVGTGVFISFFWIWPAEATMIGTSIGMGIFKAGFWIMPLWIIGLIIAALIDFAGAFKKSLANIQRH